jgi:integrase
MAKTEYFVKLFNDIVTFRDVITITPQRNRSGKISYYAFIGYDGHRKTVRRSLGQDKDKAYSLLAEANQRIAQGKLADAANVFDVASDLEIKAALKKLEGFGSTLTQAVDFFLSHHRPTAGNITIEAAKEIFLQSLKQANRSEAYRNKGDATYWTPFAKAYGTSRVIDVTRDHAEEYIFKTRANLSANMKGYHIKYLRVFFNGLAGLGYTSKELNPFAKLKIPEPTRDETKLTEKDIVLPVEDVRKLLHHLEQDKAWDVLVHQVLVLFCGFRPDEAHSLTWADINLTKKHVILNSKDAKKLRRRVVDIPDNAASWFRVCHDAMGGQWKGRTWRGLEQKLKRAKGKLRQARAKKPDDFWHCLLDFHQNSARHSCASYTYAFFNWDEEKTRKRIGHIKDAELFQSTYKELVDPKDANLFFEILPVEEEKRRAQFEEEKRRTQFKEEERRAQFEEEARKYSEYG